MFEMRGLLTSLRKATMLGQAGRQERNR
jgi:hypothetical protein